MVQEAKRAADEQSRQVEILASKQQKAGEAYEAATKRVEKVREQAAKIAAEGGSKAAQKAADAVVKAKERELKAAQDALSSLITARRKAVEAAKSSANDSAKAIEIGVSREARARTDAIKAQRAEFAKIAGEKAKAVGDVGGNLTTRVTLPLLAGAGLAIESARAYEDAMAKIKVSAEATPAQMKRIAAGTVELEGRYAKLGLSATDAANAQLELIRAGQTVGQSMKSTNAALNLAAAGEVATGESAKALTGVLNAFKLTAGESDRVADIIANVAVKSSASVQDVVLSYSQVGASAKLANVDIRESATVLKLLADAGVRGSDAGTSLKSFLVSLVGPSDKAKESLAKYKIVLQDTKGQMLPLNQILGQFREKLSGLTEMKRNEVLTQIFGTDGIRAAAVGLGVTAKEFRNIALGIDKAGEASRLANGSVGETTKAYNESKIAVQKFGREIGGTLAPVVRTVLPELTGHIRGATDWFKKLDPEQQKAMIKWTLMAAAAGPVMKTASAIFEVGRGIKDVIGTGATFFKWAANAANAWGDVGRAATAAGDAQKIAAAGGGATGVAKGAAAAGGYTAGGVATGAAAVAATVYGVYSMGQDFLGQASDQRSARDKRFADYSAHISKNVAAMYDAEIKKQGGNSAKAYAATVNLIKGGNSGMPRDNALSALNALLDERGRRGMNSGRAATVNLRRAQQAVAKIEEVQPRGGDLSRPLGNPVEIDPVKPRTARASSRSTYGGSQSNTIAAGHEIESKFGIHELGGVRASAKDPHGHPAGRALDVMVNNNRKLGDAVATWAIKNAERLGLQYVIWQQRINRLDGKGWKMMEDRGSPTANHMDHPHLNFVAGKGRGRSGGPGGGWDFMGGLLGASQGAEALASRKKGDPAFAMALEAAKIDAERAQKVRTGLATLKEGLAGLTDGRKRYADALGLSLAEYKRLAPEEQAATKRLVDQASAQERATAMDQAHHAQMADLRKRLKEVTGSDLDRIAIGKFDGKRYGELTEAHQLEVRQIKGMNDEIEAQVDRRQKLGAQFARTFLGGFRDESKFGAEIAETSRKASVKDLMEGLDQQLGKERELTAVETLRQKMQRDGIKLTDEEREKALAAAAAIDRETAAARESTRVEAVRERNRDAQNRYRDANLDLQARLGKGGTQIVTARRMKELTASFLTMPEEKIQGGFFGMIGAGVNAIGEGAKKAKEYLQFEREITEVERLRDVFRSAADGIGEGFRTALGDLVRTDFPSFFSSLGGLVEGFVSRLGQGVLDNQIQNLIGGALGQIGARKGGGGVDGAAKITGLLAGLPGRAGGGHVESGHLYRVNEERTEGFRPYSSGQVVPLAPNSRGGGGNTVNVTQHFTFSGPIDRRTQEQIGAAAYQGAAAAFAKNG